MTKELNNSNKDSQSENKTFAILSAVYFNIKHKKEA